MVVTDRFNCSNLIRRVVFAGHISRWILLTFALLWLQLLACDGFNTLRPRQHGRHFADDIFKCIFMYENIWIPIKISLKFVPNGPINNIPALVQIMAWRRSGDKPLSEPMIVSLLTHICVTRPQWVNEHMSRIMISLFLPVGSIRLSAYVANFWDLAMDI